MNALWMLLQRFGQLFIWWTTIAPWEGAIRVRLGKHQTLLAPGVHLRIPYLDKIYRQTNRFRMAGLPLQTLSTRDGKTITLSAAFGYQIRDIAKLYSTLHHAEGTLQFIAMSAIAEFVQSAILTECSPTRIEKAVNAQMDLTKYGLESGGVKVIDFAVVKTYRLINDQRYSAAGPALNTEMSDDAMDVNGVPR